jgi:hypothetical protein
MEEMNPNLIIGEETKHCDCGKETCWVCRMQKMIRKLQEDATNPPLARNSGMDRS